jgi:hypothetical protein
MGGPAGGPYRRVRAGDGGRSPVGTRSSALGSGLHIVRETPRYEYGTRLLGFMSIPNTEHMKPTLRIEAFGEAAAPGHQATGGEGGFEPPVEFLTLRRFSNANATVLCCIAELGPVLRSAEFICRFGAFRLGPCHVKSGYTSESD